MSLARPWSEHLKANIVPMLGLIGSLIYFGHTIDTDFVSIQNNQEQSKAFQVKTDTQLIQINKHLSDHDAGLDTLRSEIRELKIDINYKFEIQELKRRVGMFTERRTSHGLAFIPVK